MHLSINVFIYMMAITFPLVELALLPSGLFFFAIPLATEITPDENRTVFPGFLESFRFDFSSTDD